MFSDEQAIGAVVRSANRSLLLVSGGEKVGDEAMLTKARLTMEAGGTGLIFGRNVWQRTHLEAMHFVTALRAVLAEYPSPEKSLWVGATSIASAPDPRFVPVD